MVDASQAVADPSLMLAPGPNFINPAYSTPAQRAQLYAYANELMKQQPIRNGWQGLASMANALVGGLQFNQANKEEQASNLQSMRDATPQAGSAGFGGSSAGGGGGGSSGPAGAASSSPTSSGGSFMDALATTESANQNILSRVDPDPAGPGTRSQGYFQINTPTWQEFAKTAGVDTSQYPNAMSAPRDVQAQVAAAIPFSRFGPRTQRMLADQFGPLDKGATVGALAAAKSAPGPTMDANAPPQVNRLPLTAAGGPMAHAADGTPVMTDAQGNAVPGATVAAAPPMPPPRPAGMGGNPTGQQVMAIHAGSGPAIHPQFVDAGASPAAPGIIDRLSQAAAASPLAQPAVPPNGAPAAADIPAPNAQPAMASGAPGGSPNVPPAVAAIASHLISAPPAGGAPTAPVAPPQQVAQAAPAPGGIVPPYTPQQFGRIMGNANQSPEMKAFAAHLMTPQMFTDPYGTSRLVTGGTPGPALATGPGFAGPPSNIDGVGVQPFIQPDQTVKSIGPTGPINGAGGGAGGISQLLKPGSPTGDAIVTQQENAASGVRIAAKTAAAQERFQGTQAAGPALLQQAYPLRQVQAILDKNGGQIPTGQGSEYVQGAESIGNMVATALGHPLTGEDSNLTSLELLHKYGTMIAASQAQSLGLPHTDMGQQAATGTAPGTGLSQSTDAHLVDNLIRLNAVAQKKNKFEHDYYLSHGQGADSYDNFTEDWQKEVSGDKAIPLSKFGRDVTLKDGTAGVWVPSTDPSGFSLFRKNDPVFDNSVMAPGGK